MEATRIETGEKVKIPKKVLSAKELYENQMLTIQQYNRVTKIADSALPKHKRKRWDDIVARGWVRATQAESKFSQAFKKLKDGLTPSAASTIAKYEVADVKGEVKRLTRIVGSAWKLVGVKQSRFNHISQELKGQI